MLAQPWFFYALGSSVVWGISYALSERVMKLGISPSFLMVITGVITTLFSLALCLSMNQFKTGMANVTSDKSLLTLIAGVSLTYAIGNWLIYMAVSHKNATVASLIEISYPVFVAIFAYILYRETQLNLWTAMGGMFIFAGIAMIYLKN